MSVAALDQWEALHIYPGMSRLSFLMVFRLSYDEALDQVGLEMNNIGKSYYLMKKLGMGKAEKRDL